MLPTLERQGEDEFFVTLAKKKGSFQGLFVKVEN